MIAGLLTGFAARPCMAEWAHVRVFSPWEYNVDAEARALLEENGWTAPDPDHLPTGAELIRDYLAPLAAHPTIAPNLRLGAEVLAVTRKGHSKLSSEDRDAAPFVVLWRDAVGERHRALARAVIDASGTWVRPNPIGLDGLPVEGEIENGDRIRYGIPDVLGARREDYAGRHTLVIGAGHSAINAALDLMDLQEQEPETRITWVTRSGGIERVLGGGLNDQLPGRGRLGLRAAEAVRSGRVSFRSPFSVEQIAAKGGALRVLGTEDGRPADLTVDRIVVATGFRPDLTPLSELRLSLDPVVEATPALAPLIDPNLHSCGTVRPHGVVELAHPERDFYIVGMKSYGRAPTFLMTTGYEQVRSVVAELAGDPVAAREVRLKLPVTGVCKTGSAPAARAEACCAPPKAPAKEAACCGGPPKANAAACCVADEFARAEGESGCGCGTAARVWTAKTVVEGGTGDLFYTMNKEAAGDDLGLTLQTGFVTKALVGLFGSDRFRLAVSDDGSTFFDGLSVDNANGIVDQPRLPRFKAYTNYDNYVGVGTWTKIGLNNTDYNDQGAFDAANNNFVAPVDGTYLFGATLLYKVNASTTARMRGRLVLNGATEIRGSLGEISATHVSLATAIWLQTMVPLTAGETVELQGYFRVADGYFAADHTSFWGCKVG